MNNLHGEFPTHLQDPDQMCGTVHLLILDRTSKTEKREELLSICLSAQETLSSQSGIYSQGIHYFISILEFVFIQFYEQYVSFDMAFRLKQDTKIQIIRMDHKSCDWSEGDLNSHEAYQLAVSVP